MMTNYIVILPLFFLFLLISFIIIEAVIIFFSGKHVAIPNIPREPQTFGKGRQLNYVIIGDSISISQGSDYDDGFAIASAKHLAKKNKVTMINYGISGATSKSVKENQLEKASSFKPDILLLAVGANDATHFTSKKTLQDSIQDIINRLKEVNPRIQIILTGSPAMDSIDRFPFGAKQLAGFRTKQVNNSIKQLVDKNGLIFAPIAEKTREAFLADSSLTAADNFHPSAKGYALWIPIISNCVDIAVGRM